MKTPRTDQAALHPLWIALGLTALSGELAAGVVFEATTPYNHVLVIDAGGFRTLSFDGSQETRMSLADPAQGHFDYTELFHVAWLWNTHLEKVLIVGLGGGSTQRSFLQHYPKITIDSVEIDPVVVAVATNFFGVPLSPRHRVHVADGREFMRRSRTRYDLIIMDAYTTTPQGSTMPPHLATREQAELIREHLTPDGVAAYNMIGTLRGWKSKEVEALAAVLGEVFASVYVAPARQSMNVVLFAIPTDEAPTLQELASRAQRLVDQGTVSLPGFLRYAGSVRHLSTGPPGGPLPNSDPAN